MSDREHPTPTPPPTEERVFTGAVLERFWSKVTKAPGDGCWDWTATHDRKGYGLFHAGRNGRAHRVSWEMTHGPIPEGLFVCHRCDRPMCVRPDHLFLGTHADNTADMVAKGRTAKGDANGSRKHPESRPRGETVRSARLTEDGVRRVHDLHAAGMSTRKIAACVGVTDATVWKIVIGRNWKHIRPTTHRPDGGDHGPSNDRDAKAMATADADDGDDY